MLLGVTVCNVSHLGFTCLEALKLQCYSISYLQFSGLENLQELKEVWLSGPCSEEFKEHMQNVLACHPNEIKPVLRLPHSS